MMEATMQDGVFSQVQQAAMGAWRKALEDHMARTLSVVGRVSEMETKGQAQATAAIDEWARLMKETLSYQAELSAEWRRLGLETVQ
jgi:hypothetical protein